MEMKAQVHLQAACQLFQAFEQPLSTETQAVDLTPDDQIKELRRIADEMEAE